MTHQFALDPGRMLRVAGRYHDHAADLRAAITLPAPDTGTSRSATSQRFTELAESVASLADDLESVAAGVTATVADAGEADHLAAALVGGPFGGPR